ILTKPATNWAISGDYIKYRRRERLTDGENACEPETIDLFRNGRCQAARQKSLDAERCSN
ncbi:MAG: hypothetical protein IKW13_05775, partial [Thermoguttaceae bacterium]|nr:hypothetical protein [Thermoguttaceae bacterium]